MRRDGLYGIFGFGWRNRSVVFRILTPAPREQLFTLVLSGVLHTGSGL
jgi:hypothetical protein